MLPRTAVRAVVLILPLAGGLGCARGAPVVAPMLVLPSDTVAPVGIASEGGPAQDDRTAGDRVEVEWHGRWFAARLVERRGTEWLVRYEGYGEDEDEVVASARIRDPSRDDAPAPAVELEADP